MPLDAHPFDESVAAPPERALTERGGGVTPRIEYDPERGSEPGAAIAHSGPMTSPRNP
jgi:hypothetical protein